MSGLSVCRDCGQWIYWGEVEAADGSLRNVPYSDSAQTTLHWETCSGVDTVTDVLGNSYRVTRCTRCKHHIYWETTARGKRRPMDVWADEDTGEYSAAGQCHFETCSGTYVGGNWQAERDARESKRKAQDRDAGNKQREAARAWDAHAYQPYLVILGLSYPFEPSELTSAFRKMCLVTHPDMGGSDQAFISVKAAYDKLRQLVPA